MTETAFAAVLTEPRTFDYREYDIPNIRTAMTTGPTTRI